MHRARRAALELALTLAVCGALCTAASAASHPGPLRVVVAEFADESGARVANLGRGVADKFTELLGSQGVCVVARGELEAVLRDLSLGGASVDDLTEAARSLAADLLILGTVTSLNVQEAALDLGILRVGGAQVDVELATRVIDLEGNAAPGGGAAHGRASGAPQIALDLGVLLGRSPAADICGGGFRSEGSAISEGQLLALGYRNSSFSDWLAVEIVRADGTFVRSLGWRFVSSGDCETWLWNQRDALGMPVSPGIYAARLWNGDATLAEVSFQVRPGLLGTAAADALTVGTDAFEGTLLGGAVNDAVLQLANLFIAAQPLAIEAEALAQEPRTAAAVLAMPLLGQVASVLPDGRVAVNVGSLAGVSVGDAFEILAVEDLVMDPASLQILSYQVVAQRGVIEIVEVRDRASYGTRRGSFAPLPGDVARRLEP
ncbi:MAG: CsgG/HfaB family protein [Candidatus Bipolaricaulota bacterium]